MFFMYNNDCNADVTELPTATLRVGGFSVICRADKTRLDRVVCREVLRRDCYSLRELARLIPRPETILDVGGHIGTFGLLAKQLWPESRLIALEPNPVSADLYRKNMVASGCRNWTVLCRAIYYPSQPGAALFFVDDAVRSTGGGWVCEAEEARSVEVKTNSFYRIAQEDVPYTSLEELLDELVIEKVDLSKWDCEGSERNIFANMSPRAANALDTMIGEYHISGGFPALHQLVAERFPRKSFFSAHPRGASSGIFYAFTTGSLLISQFRGQLLRERLRVLRDRLKVWCRRLLPS
jgi:FkbM family methyltransferase